MAGKLILPEPVEPHGFNPKAAFPFGVKTAHVRPAMRDFIDFLTVIDTQLQNKRMGRFENIIMQANFSSMVGEPVAAAGTSIYVNAYARNCSGEYVAVRMAMVRQAG